MENLSSSLDPNNEMYTKTICRIILAFEGKKMVGGTIFELFPKTRCGLLSYFCVLPEYRRLGLGSVFIRMALDSIDSDSIKLNGKKCHALFLETNNPLRVSKDVFDPLVRIKALRKIGCHLLEFPYVQPPLAPGQIPDTNLVFLCVRRDVDKFFEGNIVLDFLKEFWRLQKAPLNHPYLIKAQSMLHNKKIVVSELCLENIRKMENNFSMESLPSFLSLVKASNTVEKSDHEKKQFPTTPPKFKSNL